MGAHLHFDCYSGISGDMILGYAMGMPFRFGQSIEHQSALLLDLVGEPTRTEDGVDTMKRERLAQP